MCLWQTVSEQRGEIIRQIEVKGQIKANVVSDYRLSESQQLLWPHLWISVDFSKNELRLKHMALINSQVVLYECDTLVHCSFPVLVLKSHTVFFRWLFHAVLPKAANKDELLLAVRRSPSCFLVWNVSVFADCSVRRRTSMSTSVCLLILTLIYWKSFYCKSIVVSQNNRMQRNLQCCV